MNAKPENEHEWLHRLIGEWTFEVEAKREPGCAPGHFKGTENVRTLGGLWIVAEGHGEMPGGGSAATMMTLGYDPTKQRYLGTWVGSMMTHLWIYDGALDATGRVLTLGTEGPAMTDEGKLTKFRDVIELESDDRRMLTSHMLGEDGEWHHFMTAHYRRRK